MNILFIYFNRYMRPRTQLSLSILETIVKKEGYNTKIFDTSFYRESLDEEETRMLESGIHKKTNGLSIEIKNQNLYEDFKKVIINFNPQLIAFSFYLVDMDIHKVLLEKVKNDFPDIKIVCGGPTASVNPKRCFDNDYVDYVCFGEGEEVLKELCKRMSNKKSCDDIAGLWTKKDGKIIENGLAPLTDLSTLPIQNWDSYNPIHIYGLFEGRAYRMGHAETMRGCPFDCSYCGSGSIKKEYKKCGINYIRYKSAKQIVEECLELKNKYKLEMFYFTVGTFTAIPRKILRELSELYSKKVGLPFICLVHPMTIDDEVAELLSKMGCIHTSIGIESGVDEFRKRVFNRKMSNERIISSIKALKKNNIHVSTYNIIGVPGMDRKHVFDTIELNKIANPNSSLVSILVPFPDTKITEDLIKDGIIKKDETIIKCGIGQSIEIKEMTKKEIDGLFKTFNLYVQLPKYFYSIIKFLEKDTKISNYLRKIVYKILNIKRSHDLHILRKKIGS